MSGKMFRNGVLFGSPLLNITTATALTIRNILYAELISGGSEKFNFRVVDCDYADSNKLTQTTCVLWYYTSKIGLSVNYILYPRESALIQQEANINVINFMGESLYGNIDQNILAFKNIVSCAYKEIDSKIVRGPEYKMASSDAAANVYHNLTFVDTS